MRITTQSEYMWAAKYLGDIWQLRR